MKLLTTLRRPTRRAAVPALVALAAALSAGPVKADEARAASAVPDWIGDFAASSDAFEGGGGGGGAGVPPVWARVPTPAGETPPFPGPRPCIEVSEQVWFPRCSVESPW